MILATHTQQHLECLADIQSPRRHRDRQDIENPGSRLSYVVHVEEVDVVFNQGFGGDGEDWVLAVVEDGTFETKHVGGDELREFKFHYNKLIKRKEGKGTRRIRGFCFLG